MCLQVLPLPSWPSPLTSASGWQMVAWAPGITSSLPHPHTQRQEVGSYSHIAPFFPFNQVLKPFFFFKNPSSSFPFLSHWLKAICMPMPKPVPGKGHGMTLIGFDNPSSPLEVEESTAPCPDKAWRRVLLAKMKGQRLPGQSTNRVCQKQSHLLKSIRYEP